jgi:ABC-type methionine transport system ATPase subunit
LTDAPPNVYLKNGKFTGFDNDLFTAVAAKLDLKVQFVGMVFQHFNLFPHKSVLANITLGLRKLRDFLAKRRTQQLSPNSTGLGSDTRHRCDPACFRGVNSSGWPSPARWPCRRR